MIKKTIEFIPEPAPQSPSTRNPLLSIIIPARNNFTGLLTSLSSYYGETAKQIEWIIVDDGSEAILADQLPITEYKVRILRNERSLGAGYSRNIGLSMAKGYYVLFFDADDVLRMDSLNKILSVLETGIYDLLIFKYYIEQESIVLKHMNKNDITTWNRLSISLDPYDVFKFITFPWNRIVKRRLLEEKGVQFQNTVVFNDMYAVWKMTDVADKILLVPDPLCIYANMNQDMRISGIKDSRRLQIFIPLLAIMKNCADDARQMEELFNISWNKRYLADTLIGRDVRLSFLSLLNLFFRRFPKETIRNQTLWRRFLISRNMVFRTVTLCQARLKTGVIEMKKWIVDIIWGNYHHS